MSPKDRQHKLIAGFIVTGTLPTSWGSPGAFPNLSLLTLELTNLSGTLPPSWGNGSFPALQQLQIGAGISGSNLLSGTLPPEWGDPSAFQNLVALSIANCTIHGRAVVFLYGGSFIFHVRAFWMQHTLWPSISAFMYASVVVAHRVLLVFVYLCNCVDAHLSMHARHCVLTNHLAAGHTLTPQHLLFLARSLAQATHPITNFLT